MMELLVSYPETRQHLADPGFLAAMTGLQKQAIECDMNDVNQTSTVSQKIAQVGQKDPRVMQAVMSLMGQSMTVDEKDLKKAESHGDMKRREPVQLEQLVLVKSLLDPEECRVKGNEYFKSGDYPAALAHYEKGVERLKQDLLEFPAAQLAALQSNIAFCYLKLEWPDRAKKSATLGLKAVREGKDVPFDQSKLFYRRSLACEGLQEFDLAVEDMERALQFSDQASSLRAKFRSELARLRKLRESHNLEQEKRKTQKENEKAAEVERLQGQALGGERASEAESTYITETDKSHRTRQRVTEAVERIKLDCSSGAKIEIYELREISKVSASVTTKRGKRALYYEMDLHMKWRGQAAPKLKPSSGPSEMDGVIRVYNIAHDTKFELGGDENTSYMYQLGWDQRLNGKWADGLRNDAADLFDLVADAVDGVIRDLRSK